MQIPCGVTGRKRDREGPEPAEPTPALRATPFDQAQDGPPERGVFPIPSWEGIIYNGAEKPHIARSCSASYHDWMLLVEVLDRRIVRHNVRPLDTLVQTESIAQGLVGKNLKYSDLVA